VSSKEDGTKTLKTKECPVVNKFYDLEQTFAADGHVYSIKYPYARKNITFGNTFLSLNEYEKITSANYKRFINRKYNNSIIRLLKNNKIRNIVSYKENVWPRQERQGHTESVLRTNYDFPWSYSLTERVTSGGHITQYNKLYGKFSITTTYSTMSSGH
jgi:hypothetical protein